MGNWADMFDKSMKWVGLAFLILMFLVSAGLGWADLISSYHGWGKNFRMLSVEVGDITSIFATGLPTLIQAAAWAGIASNAEYMKHNTFRFIALVSFAADSVGDCIHLGVFDNIRAGNWELVGFGMFTVLILWGFMSEFIFGFSAASIFAQLKMMNINFGFQRSGGSSRRSMPDLSSIMGGGLGKPPTSSRPSPARRRPGKGLL